MSTTKDEMVTSSNKDRMFTPSNTAQEDEDSTESVLISSGETVLKQYLYSVIMDFSFHLI